MDEQHKIGIDVQTRLLPIVDNLIPNLPGPNTIPGPNNSRDQPPGITPPNIPMLHRP